MMKPTLEKILEYLQYRDVINIIFVGWKLNTDVNILFDHLSKVSENQLLSNKLEAIRNEKT